MVLIAQPPVSGFYFPHQSGYIVANTAKLRHVIVLLIAVGVEFCKIKAGLAATGFVENTRIGQRVCAFMGVLTRPGVLLCVAIRGVIGLLRHTCVIEHANREGTDGDAFGFGDHIAVAVFDCQVKL